MQVYDGRIVNFRNFEVWIFFKNYRTIYGYTSESDSIEYDSHGLQKIYL